MDIPTAISTPTGATRGMCLTITGEEEKKKKERKKKQ
jgi:hypothetical protein